MRNRWFWLANLALLLLYSWTLTEESAVRVQVARDECTAVFPERANLTRTSSIPCPGLQGGFVGLYFSDNNGLSDWGPLEWVADRSGWRSVTFSGLREGGNQLLVKVAEDVPGWQRVWGEWRPMSQTAVMRWQTPIYGDYLIETNLRRPSETAGILLLKPDGENGWAFITSPDKRRGVWWAWEDDRPTYPIVGIPFQKTALAQTQSLLRRALRAHQAGLLLLLAGWLLAKFVSPQRAQRFSTNSLRSSRSLRLIFRSKTAVLLITLSVFGATVYIADDVLERIPHVQDSMTYLFQAEILAREKLWADAPPLPAFFEHDFLLTHNGRWFGQYPPGFPAVLAIGVLLKQPWLVNPLMATLTIPLLYGLGRALYGRSTARIAIFLTLTSPFFLFMSGSMMAHTAELFWVTGFMFCWALALRRDERRWPLLAGLALGMVFLTRQTTIVTIALPFYLVTGLGRLEIKAASGLQSPVSIFKKTGWLLMTAVPIAALLLLYQNALTGHLLGDPRLLLQPYDRLGFSEDIGHGFNAFTLSEIGGQVAVDWYNDPSQPPRGHTLARGIYNTEQNWRALETHLFGWLPFLTLAFIWLAFLSKRPSTADVALLAGIGSIKLLYIFYWADGIMYGPRYYYGALPALFLLAARGMQAAAQKIGHGGQTAVTLLAVAFILGNLLFYLPETLENHRGYNFINGQERTQVEAEIEGKALIFIANNPVNWWEYGRFFSSNTPWLDGRLIFVRDLGDEENGRLFSHFPNHTPYRWQDGRLELLELATTMATVPQFVSEPER